MPPADPRSLIRVFADPMCLLQPPGYPKRDEGQPLPYWVDVQANMTLCWSHRPYCRFCRVLAPLDIDKLRGIGKLTAGATLTNFLSSFDGDQAHTKVVFPPF